MPVFKIISRLLPMENLVRFFQTNISNRYHWVFPSFVDDRSSLHVLHNECFAFGSKKTKKKRKKERE